MVLPSIYLTVNSLVDTGGLGAHFEAVFCNSENLFCTQVVFHTWRCLIETLDSLVGAAASLLVVCLGSVYLFRSLACEAVC